MKFLTTEYRGYVGSIEHSKEDGVFFGSIQFITDMVSYESEDLNNIETAFHNAVDEYIADCSSLNKLPDKPTQQKKFVDWHPYPKEKPPKTGEYLVTWLSLHTYRFPWVTIREFNANTNKFDYEDGRYYIALAWAELPEPYNSSSKGK